MNLIYRLKNMNKENVGSEDTKTHKLYNFFNPSIQEAKTNLDTGKI